MVKRSHQSALSTILVHPSAMFFRSKSKQPESSKQITLPKSPQHSTKSIDLHNLCQNCSGFCRQWEVLDWLQQSNSPRSPQWPISRLCTLEQLIATRNTCHLCKFLSTSLRLSDNRLDSCTKRQYVLLHPQPRENGQDQYLRASVADKPALEYDDITLSAAIVLKTHNSEPLGVLPRVRHVY